GTPEAAELPARIARCSDVHTTDLGERPREALAVSLWSSCTPAVAVSPVEEPVRPELQLAAVVVRGEVLDEHQLLRGRRDRADAVRAVLHDMRVAALVGVVDVEAVGPLVLRIERDREQTLLAAAQHPARDVEERSRAD